jgi:hypothetical protein
MSTAYLLCISGQEHHKNENAPVVVLHDDSVFVTDTRWREGDRLDIPIFFQGLPRISLGVPRNLLARLEHRVIGNGRHYWASLSPRFKINARGFVLHVQ